MSRSMKTWVILAVFLGVMAYAIAEELVLTTYYPSPRGVYNQLRTSGDVGVGNLNAATARLHVIQEVASDAFRVDDQPADTTPFIINQDGRVLIGRTTVPATNPKVHVVGPVEADAFRAFETSGVYAYLEGAPNDNRADIGGFSLATNQFAQVRFDGAPILLQTRFPPGPALNTAARNVGIGVTNPGMKLDVAGRIRIRRGATAFDTAGVWLTNQTGTTNLSFVGVERETSPDTVGFWNNGWRMVVDNNGNVGIADTTPAALLTVGASDLFRVQSTGHVRTIAGTTGSPAYSFTSDTNTGMRSGGADNLRLVTGGADRLTITSAGSIGMGTATPAAADRLHIVGWLNLNGDRHNTFPRFASGHMILPTICEGGGVAAGGWICTTGRWRGHVNFPPGRFSPGTVPDIVVVPELYSPGSASGNTICHGHTDLVHAQLISVNAAGFDFYANGSPVTPDTDCPAFEANFMKAMIGYLAAGY